MLLPRNEFKHRLASDDVQYGLWMGLTDPIAAEINATAGFDWILIDGEHAPNDSRSVMLQLQAMAAYPVSPIVRPLRGEAALIKQMLDVGTSTILVPMVESAEQAAELVRAVHYPPSGVRGVATTRASRWGLVEDYWDRAGEEVCLILQIESVAGLENLDEIAAVEGVDALFVGPSDLGASLGHLGQANHAEVRSAVRDAIGAIRGAGKAAGVLAVTPELANEYVEAGANFVGVGVDTRLLATGVRSLAKSFKDANTGMDIG